MGLISWPRACAALILVAAGWAGAQPPDGGGLKPFAGDEELRAYFEPFAAERRRLEELRRKEDEARRLRDQEMRRRWEADNPGKTWSPPVAQAPHPAPAAAPVAQAAESITNTQTAGVDEGGIVKVHGKHLVILRRGRLFTVDIDRHRLDPVASADAFGPGAPPGGAWYDEMLVSGNTVVVIGYSYSRGGTELGLFDIDAAGGLRHRATYHLRSADYYSSRNYASRLIGNKLILYAPIPISLHHADPLARLPALRRWRQGATAADFKRIAPPTRIYRTDEPLSAQDGSAVLHAVISCDLAAPELDCESSGVLGSWGRVFYVSSTAVYVWSQQRGGGAPNAEAALFRLPLDGAVPGAIKASGSPIDQFSFLEEPDGRLNVLLRGTGAGDGMWAGERGAAALSLLRVARAEFGDGRRSAPPEAYRSLPAPGSGPLQNRYVGGTLLYGAGSGWYRPQESVKTDLYAVPLAGGAPARLPLPHGVDRLEALGADAVAIGSDGRNLNFSTIRLAGTPQVANRWMRANASQAETRSHGFFYKPESATGGIVGLPVRGGGQGGWRQLWDEPAGMLYLRTDGLQLAELGALAARPGIGRNDGCHASCTDWYGNARPIFLAGRMFALLGYELVEGRVLRPPKERGRLIELRRVSFAPGSEDYRH